MFNEFNPESTVSAFWQALESRRLDDCTLLASRIEQFAQQEPSLGAEACLIRGVLIFESTLDFVAAEKIFLTLLQESLPFKMHARVLRASGRIYQVQGQYQDAINAYEESLAFFEELNADQDVAKCWKQIAICYSKGYTQGEFDANVLKQAIECCHRGLASLEIAADKAPLLEGTIWNTLGAVYMNLERWPEAVVCYERDLEICRNQGDRHGMALSFNNIGEIHQKQGPESWPAALAAYERALTLVQEFGDHYEEIDILANLANLSQEKGQPTLALGYYGKAIQRIEQLRAHISSHEGRTGFAITITNIYTSAILLCVEQEAYEQAFLYMEQARARSFLEKVAAGSSELAAQTPVKVMTLGEVQKILPQKSLVLLYFTTGILESVEARLSNEQAPDRHRFPPSKILLLAVTRNSVSVHILPISPNDLVPQRADRVTGNHFLQLRMRRTLYDALISPVHSMLTRCKLLYLVPHGPLHYVPFQALVSGDDQPLLQNNGPKLVYGPSASVLFRPSLSKSKLEATDSCLAIGYNSYDEARLQLAEKEAVDVAQQLKGYALTGVECKKSDLYKMAPTYAYLHFSCHGTFNTQEPIKSAISIAKDETLTVEDVLDRLVLNCRLVTVSACNTGISHVNRGDELSGFARAFMAKGAQAVLVTMWQVPEHSTLILMSRFYREVASGTDLANSLKRAQLSLRAMTGREAIEVLRQLTGDSTYSIPEDINDTEPIFADPFYWAAFVLIGHHEAI